MASHVFLHQLRVVSTLRQVSSCSCSQLRRTPGLPGFEVPTGTADTPQVGAVIFPR